MESFAIANVLYLHINKRHMKKFTLLAVVILLCTAVSAQRLLSWTPQFPTADGNITFTIDCNKGNQGLLNYQAGSSTDVYVHVGVNTNLSTGPGDWRYVKFTNFNAPAAGAQATALGGNRYSYTITNIRAFFAVPAAETILKVNCIFRSGNGSLKQVNSDGSDMYIPMYTAGQFATRFNLPPSEPRFVPYLEPINIAVGGTIVTEAVSSLTADINLKLNGTQVASAPAVTVINSTITIPTNCEQKIIVEAVNGAAISKDSIQFTIAQAATVAPLPAGAIEGINYNPNNTSVTLVLFAPNKTSVSVIGDFNNWQPTCASSMAKTADGNYWWITLNGLTSGQEYRFQYLVNNTIKIADPYCQKILDPFNDQFINAVTYPGLIAYPTGLTTDIVGVFQTAEPQYNWTTTGYVKPDRKNLIIYELLIRDFTAEHSFQSLIDSIQYLKNLGINAIELMPVNEFDGNESWGYNPAYFFAVDKYYGTKNKLKQFIDLCHANGIAVLLDVVYNHCTGAAPQAKMYWNAATNQPTADNPWLNVTAPHPYSVFNDFNHSSAATKYFVKRNLKFWLDEFKIDGYRFDLAKGFTQLVTNTTTVENYDASRVANLNEYYDATIASHPSAYMILEFLGTTPSTEEQAYVNKGFMMWANLNSRYNQNTMGFASNSNISGIMYNSTDRNFSAPAAVGYMESHDEERLMYRNITFGNANGSYNTKDLNTALKRMEAGASVFFMAPGPKMIWQFGERGYDVSINFGGSNVSNKPPRWEYMTVPERRALYEAYKKMINFRLQNQAIFNNPTFTFDLNDAGGLFRKIQIQDPAANGKMITVIANMDVVPVTKSVVFQSTGGWTNFMSNGTGAGVNASANTNFTLTNATQSITLQPGEYHIYLSLAPCTTTAPAVTATVNYCQGATATQLTATGTNLLWYTSSTSTTGATAAPTPSTNAIGSTSYFVSQTANGCEGPRAEIVVNVAALSAAPIVTSPVLYCQGSVATALTATGTALRWYSQSTGGTSSSAAPVPVTTAAGSTNFYVSQTSSCGESPRALIQVTVAPTPAPVTQLSATNITTNSAVLSWVGVAGNFYTVEFRVAGSASWTVASAGLTQSTYSLSNLTIATNYDWRVSSNCNNLPSANYATATFKTTDLTTPLIVSGGIGMNVFPNPASTTARLTSSFSQTGPATVVLLNSMGQSIKVLYTGNRQIRMYNLDLSPVLRNLSKGTYYINIIQGNNQNSIPFIKN